MPEPISLNEGEQTVTAHAAANLLHIRIARYVSIILSPIVVSLPAILLVALYHERNQLMAVVYACMALFFLSIGPMIYILIGVRRGKFTDLDVSQRSQRSGPFLFSITSTFIGFITLTLTHGPKNLQTALLITAIIGVIMMITTLWWKISVHASSLASTVTMLTVLYGAVILPAYSLVVLVGWARVVLHRHTVAQVIAGSMLSIVLSTIILEIRGI